MKKRYRIAITGTVQGVGFRPFIWRLASELSLSGWVENGVSGVVIEAEAEEQTLEMFVRRIKKEKPVVSRIEGLGCEILEPVNYDGFVIRKSDDLGEKTALVLPDLATCPDCLRDISDPKNRRYRYPFTNCTNCGPRFSLIEGVPYDRPNTSMKDFQMCPHCEREYKDPSDRRFHAEPNACPECGPQLELLDRDGEALSVGDTALSGTEELVRDGKIVAIKGIGGFQLIADARNTETVRRLRKAKGRPGEKPFAVMCQSIEILREYCEVSDIEKALLLSPESPIVLLRKKTCGGENVPCADVAPGSDTLGVMLPYTPLHYLLLADLGFPIVCTSGNISDEPIITDNEEVVDRLGHIADAFLVNNRTIVRHVDDSIARVVLGETMILRRARGYVPLPVSLEGVPSDAPVVAAFGAHLKSAGAVLIGNNVFPTQHIGDLETVKAALALELSIRDILAFRGKKPDIVVCDIHPDYVSTAVAERFAEEFDVPLYRVGHHRAHVLSCMAENGLLGGSALGIAWDGTGFGDDGLSWGGEFFRIRGKELTRIGHLGSFPLIGGDAAAREPKRIASALLYSLFGEDVFQNEEFAPVRALSFAEKKAFPQMLRTGTGLVYSTSMGRLFDAVASLLDVCHSSSYEGHAAIMLEQAIEGIETEEAYAFLISSDPVWSLQWKLLLLQMLCDRERGVPTSIISAKFHNGLANSIVAAARDSGERTVVLSGGCFQNKYLLERTVTLLRKDGREPVFHRRVPTNDGGIAVGQIASIILELNN